MYIICCRISHIHFSSRYNVNYIFVVSYPYRHIFSYSEIVKTNNFGYISIKLPWKCSQNKSVACNYLIEKNLLLSFLYLHLCRYVNFVHNDKLNASGDILFDRIIYLLTTYLSRSFFLFYVIYSACIIPLFPTQLLRSIST